MSKQTIILLFGGLFVVVIAALLTQSLLKTRQQEAPVVVTQEVPTEILVMAKSMKKGDLITESDVIWQKWPKDMVFTGATLRGGTYPETVDITVGKLRRDVEGGEILLQSDLVQDETGNFVAATLAPGMRAFTIEVNAITGVGGFLKPGDYVDLILSYDVSLPSDPDIAEAAATIVSRGSAQMLAENVRVMAIDQTATEIEGIVTARSVTIEVSPRQAEILALAKEMGTISFALRKQGDDALRNADAKTETVTDIRLSDVLNEVMGDGAGTIYSLGEKKPLYTGGNTHISIPQKQNEGTNEQEGQ